MSEHAHEDIRRLFDLVLDVPGDQRASVLERECGGDDGLRARILAMIDAVEDGRFLGNATAQVGVLRASCSTDAATVG